MSHPMHPDVTTGEVYRLVLGLQAEVRAGQSDTRDQLEKIVEQTTATNGTVTRHGERITVLDRDVKELKSSRVQVQALVSATGGDDKRAVTLSIPMDVKTVVVVIGALAAVVLWVLKGLAP